MGSSHGSQRTERYRHCTAAILIGKRALATDGVRGQQPCGFAAALGRRSASPTTPQAYIGEQLI